MRTLTVPQYASDSEGEQDPFSPHQAAMDGFSLVSLSSLCSSISCRTLASIDEVESIVEATRHEGLASLVGMLHGVNRGVLHLEASLNAATVISTKLQADLSKALEACDIAIAASHKQLERLGLGDVSIANKAFLAPQYDFLASHIQLFTYFQKILQKRSGQEQDASLEVEGVAVLAEADSTIRTISESEAPFVEPDEVNTANSHVEVPPPYDPTAASVPPFPGTPTSPSSSTSRKFSWSESFKALTSSLRPKPDPMVSALCQATLRGDERQISGLASQGANVNGRDEEGNTPLQCAVQTDQEGAAQLLISLGADWKSSTWSGIPPLFQAASKGSTRVARVLMKKGARVDERSVSGQPYFADVVASGNVEGIKLLLKHGANPQANNISGRPVLAIAVKKGNVEVARLLLDHGADPNASDISGNSLLSMASEKEDLMMAELLLSRGAKPNSRSATGVPVLVDAISKKRLDYAKKLLTYGADANAKDWYSQSILVGVIRDSKLDLEEKINMARTLLEHGASANASDHTWSRPIISHAMEMGSTELLALLLQHGAKTKVTMSGGETLLLYALDRGDRDAVMLLLEHGASPKVKDKKGRTPLMEALLKQDFELVHLLVQHGADVKMTSTVSPADVARAMGRPDILQSLGLNDEAVVARPEIRRKELKSRSTGDSLLSDS